ncbi:hypothetical protein HHK36_020929 [Tetracentron sinense]|uniref:gibberellin 2beta-dioxygenase n=1 Tax=Tetracentron sinense TaxID=13715 RepID=A0A835DBH8_TETSI|nr:hypothetical protein HHK36_020929 [Tetracentron sinense]
MVVPSPTKNRSVKARATGLPIIDLSGDRSHVRELIVEACEDYGFFKVINHGVPKEIIARMEQEGVDFFEKPASKKKQAGPPNPFGYGSKNIGFNGDMGEVEYLLLHTNPVSISQSSKTISNDPTKFSCAVNDYIEAVREVACEILELMAEGLWVPDKTVFSSLIRDVDSDSLFRLNHYPPINTCNDWDTSPSLPQLQFQNSRLGFGEHSDPQVLTILRSNNVGGLQISLDNGVWVPVPPDPTAFCVIVGDAMQVLTNGRFMSVRHRALANSFMGRMSMVYFGAPPLHAWISPLPEMVTPQKPCIYRPFTWAEYKKAAYSLQLGDNRLNHFTRRADDDDIA